MASKRKHGGETDESCESQPAKGKKTNPKVYKQVYKHEYSTAFPSLRVSAKGPHHANCTVCKIDFTVAHGGRYDCKKHCESAAHKSIQKGIGKLSTLEAFCQRSSASSSLQSQITNAEAILCGLVAEMNLPLSAMDTFTKAMTRMFPDSKIAAGLKCGRNKATAVVKEMSAMAMDDLARRMRERPFSIATDGSNDADKKQFPLVVTIQGATGLVNAELLALPVCAESATGENIFNLIDKEFSAQKIPWNNCIALGCDNANVMTGVHKGVYSFVKEKQPTVHLANCCLHLVHIAAKKGAACLPPVEDILIDSYYYFQKSVNRQTELKHLQDLYDTDQRKVLKHVCTRWLSIARCLDRLLANWEPLLHFFREEKKKGKKDADGSSYSSKKVEAVCVFLKSPTNKLYCRFLAYTLKVYNPILLQLQAQGPMIHVLHKNLTAPITDLFNRFLLPSALRSPDGKLIDLHKVEYQLRSNQKEGCDLLIGSDAKKMVQKPEEHFLKKERIQEFYSSVRKYFATVIQYLLEKMPLKDPLLKNAVVVDYKEQRHLQPSQLEYFVHRFPSLVPPDTNVDDLLEQFVSYQTTDISDCFEEGDRVDKVWAEVEKRHPSLKSLTELMRGIMSIPHSSAACERIFSMVRKSCTEGRSSMLHDTTEALLVLKGMPGSCLDDDRQFSQDSLTQLKSAYYNQLKKC